MIKTWNNWKCQHVSNLKHEEKPDVFQGKNLIRSEMIITVQIDYLGKPCP